MIAEILLLVISFLILLSLGVPVAWSIGISCLLTLAVSIDSIAAFTTMAQRMATGLDSFSLLAIPFFILAGQIMNQGGIAHRLINFAKALIGSLPGGLIYVNVIAAMLFGAISGSAVAAASAIGGILGPPMEKENYSKEFGAAINVTASTTGLIIPPSNVLIVYSLASGGVSIASLFLAGYIPGILMGLALMLVAAVWIKKKKYPPGEKTNVKRIATSFLDALPSLLLLVVVIGGIVSGIFTATEASGIAVLYTLVLAAIYREINLKKLHKIFLNSVVTTSIVLLLIATSMGMSWVMSFENIPQTVSDALLGLSDNKYVILIIINLLLLFVGTFMDMTPAILIFTPIFLPIMQSLGVDPVHFGMIMVMNLCVGLCTPPVGSVLFIGVGVAKTTIQKVIKPLLPLYVVMAIILLLVTYVPQISLWLPSLFE
ncbi:MULTISPECIES: TRAP transporter large permease [Mesonia]|uniref:TRAP transporter large permease n=2 Tax=Flavobacteriaceae TaxID=49546 RepID=UPI00176FFABC|nr:MULTISPECIES: TRAP transporter large permease subunit [Mesonia]HIB36067.1 TRAP transporter large permease subunit [Mesonia sp.]HIO26263.1 TRAP transporter large permease subunit [Flavobacteriaceae bacterium]